PAERISLCMGVNRACTQFLQLAVNPGWEGSQVEYSVHDLATGRLVQRMDPGEMVLPATAFRPDGRQVAILNTQGAVLSDVATGRPTRIAFLRPRLREAAVGLAYHPKGDRLATANVEPGKQGEKDRELVVRLWDAETGKELGPPLCGPVFADQALPDKT